MTGNALNKEVSGHSLFKMSNQEFRATGLYADKQGNLICLGIFIWGFSSNSFIFSASTNESELLFIRSRFQNYLLHDIKKAPSWFAL